MRRIGYRFGVVDPPGEGPKGPAQPMNDEMFARLKSNFPVLPKTFIQEPMSPEEFRKIHG